MSHSIHGAFRRPSRGPVKTRRPRRDRARFEALEPRAMLAIVLPTAPAFVGTIGDMGGAQVDVLGTGAGVTNDLSVKLTDQAVPGHGSQVVAELSDGVNPSRFYFNFNNLITFSGLTLDPANTQNNVVSFQSPYGVALTGGAGVTWNSIGSFALANTPLAAVTFTTTGADELAITTAVGTSSIVDRFQSPTTNGTTGAKISFTSRNSGDIDVLPAGVQAWSLELTHESQLPTQDIDLQGDIKTNQNLSLTSNVNLTVDQRLQAGGTLVLDTTLVGLGGAIVIDSPVVADGDVTVKSEQLGIVTNASVTSRAGAVSLNAATTLAVNDDLAAKTGLTLVGNTGITTNPAADLASATGGITLTSLAGPIAVAGSMNAVTTGAVTLEAAGPITAAAVITANSGTITLTSTAGSITASGSLVATTTGDVVLDAEGFITSSATLTATGGKASLTSALGSVTTTGPIQAFESVTFDAAINVMIEDSVTVTGAAPGAGLITALAHAGDLVVAPASPLRVQDGQIKLEATAGTATIEALVTSNLAIDVKSGRGFALSNAVDLGAGIVATGPLGSVTITNAANLLLVDAPVVSLNDAVTITSDLDDLEVRDDVFANLGMKITAETLLTVDGLAAPITLTSLVGSIELTSTTNQVVAGPDLVFVLPGDTAGLKITAGTVVDLLVPVTAGGDIAIVSPDGFTLQQQLVSTLNAVSITAANGTVAVVLAPVRASDQITLTGREAVVVDNVLASTIAGVSLVSAGGNVVIGKNSQILVPDATAGTIDIDAGLALTLEIPLNAGFNIGIKTALTFAPTTDITSANGDISLTVTGGNLDVSGCTLTATGMPGGSISLSAAAGAVTLGPYAVNPVFGDLTIVSGLPFVPGVLPLVVGGNLTVQSGGGLVAPPPVSLTSLNGSISLTYDNTINVTGITISAAKGGVTLVSKTQDVLVGPVVVDVATVAGDVTFSAPQGVVTFAQPLTAGGNVAINSFKGYTTGGDITSVNENISITSAGGGVAVGHLLTALTGDITLESKALDVAITKDLFAADALTITALGEINNGVFNGPVTTKIQALTFVARASGVLSKLAFTNPENDVEEATLELTAPPTGAGVTYVDANAYTVQSVISATGNVSLSSMGGPITVNGGIGATAGETLTNVSVTAPGAIAINGNVVAALGSIDINSAGGAVSVAGSLTSCPAPAAPITVTAGAGILVTGNIVAGDDAVLTSLGGTVTLGAAGATVNIDSKVGDVLVSAVGAVTVTGANVTAPLGSIRMATPFTLAFDGGILQSNLTYTNLPPAPVVGLVELSGLAGIDVITSPVIRAGRLEIIGGGGGAITLDSALNDVDTLQVEAGGNFTYYQELVPLAIDDPDDLANATVQVTSTGGFISITSLAGLRIVDGLEYNTTLSLVGRQLGDDPGVEFVVTDGGDNPSPPNPPHPFGFAGTLRDMLNYVNDNIATDAAGTGNTPMRVVFDDARSPTVVALDDTLPEIVKSITFDGTRLDGSLVELDGTGVAVPFANGLTLGTGSAGSVIEYAYIYGFDNAAVSATSGQNVFRGLTLGDDAAGNAPGNGIGLLLTGPLAVQNVVGIRDVGDLGNTFVANGTGLQIFDRANYTTVQGNGVYDSDEDGIAVVGSLGTLIGSDADGVYANEISGNGRHGIYLENIQGSSIAYGATIQGNTIELNGASGIQITGGGRNLVGGTNIAAGNTISGNLDGVRIESSLLPTPSNNNHVYGNTISDNDAAGVHIQAGYANVVSGNAISGSGNPALPGNIGAGVRIVSATATKDRLTNFVVSNTLTANGNTENDGGILLENSKGQVIGVDTKGQTLGNTLTGNTGSGIVIRGNSTHTLNSIVGNTVTGSTFDGIRVSGAVGTTVKGNTASGNVRAGISVVDALSTATTGNLVQRNVASGNQVGIQVAGSRFTQVGGTLAADRNFVHSNTSDGIRVERSVSAGASQGTLVRSNIVGVTPGSAPAGNTGYGISITDSTGTVVDYANLVRNNLAGGILVQGGNTTMIGSAVKGRANTIAANGQTVNGVSSGNGITIQQSAASVSQKQVNVTVAGNLIESNKGDGIFVTGARASAVTIGQAPSITVPNGTGNTIRDNTGVGIRVDAAKNVTMIGNSIYDNDDPAGPIVLQNGGNGSLAAPTQLRAKLMPGNVKNPQWEITGRVGGTTVDRFYVDIYMDVVTGGQVFMGRVLVQGGKTFRVLLRGPANGVGKTGIRATSTAAIGGLSGSTSAFSAYAV